VTIVNRTYDRAIGVALALGVHAAHLDSLPGLAWDVLVNATPMGKRGERFIDPKLLCGQLVLDAVYGPTPTRLVSDAAARGIGAVDGLEMLVAQGVRQFELLTGGVCAPAVLESAARAWLRPGGRGGRGRG
jgi:shikimate dehydrogenase